MGAVRFIENLSHCPSLTDGRAGEFVRQDLSVSLDSQIFQKRWVFRCILTPQLNVVFPQLIVGFAIEGGFSFSKTPVVAFNTVAFDIQLVSLFDGSSIAQAAKQCAETSVAMATEFVALIFFGKAR